MKSLLRYSMEGVSLDIALDLILLSIHTFTHTHSHASTLTYTHVHTTPTPASTPIQTLFQLWIHSGMLESVKNIVGEKKEFSENENYQRQGTQCAFNAMTVRVAEIKKPKCKIFDHLFFIMLNVHIWGFQFFRFHFCIACKKVLFVIGRMSAKLIDESRLGVGSYRYVAK